MRLTLLLLLLLASAAVPVAASDESDAVAVVEKTFQGMAAHDGAVIRSTMLPDARLYSVRADAPPAARTVEDFVTQIVNFKGELLEKFIGKPAVTIRGRIAQVWGEYELWRDGKFGHCGVDSASLLKTAEGWKIAAITFTMETAGCAQK